MGILSRLGLSKPVNPPATVDPIGFIDWEAKFNAAAKDLAAEVISRKTAERARDEAIEKYAELASKYNEVVEENIALRPDAEAMRAKRKRDRDLKAEKAQAAAAPKAASKKAAR